jgi:hypothetical protein
MPAGSIGLMLQRLIKRVEHEHAQRQLVRDFERLVDRPRLATAGAGPVIGFATFGSGAWHLGLEALLAHALILRGARPELLVCDLPDLPACDERTALSRDRDRCAGCLDDKRALLEASRLRWRGVSGFVPEGLQAGAAATVAALRDSELEQHVECGFPIGQWLHVSVSHFLRRDAAGMSAEAIGARRRFLATAIVIVHAVERWLDELRPAIVIAESGAHVMWRIAFELARARGIPVICREMGKGGWDRHIYALNADAMAPDLSSEWAQIAEQPLSPGADAAVDTALEQLPASTFAPRAVEVTAGASPIAAMRDGGRVIVAFTNVTWDLATAGRDVAFGGVRDWLDEVVRVVARLPRTHLIVRAHPAEASVITREGVLDHLPVAPAQVTLIGPESPIAARDLIERADLVLVYNSTAGIEAVMRGKAVLVAGRPHYRGKGFTNDIESRAALAAALEAWAADPASLGDATARERARRYFHLFFLRYHIPMGWTTSPLDPPYELVIRSLDELAPGRNQALDVVCDGILQGHQMLLPRPFYPEVATCTA